MTAKLEHWTWSLELPDGWTSEEAGDAVAVFRPDGVGALQISAHFRESLVSDEDLRELAEEHLRKGAAPKPVQLGAFVGFQIAFAAADTFWSQWLVRRGQQALFVTYNCPVAERGHEYDEAKMLLQTLRATDA